MKRLFIFSIFIVLFCSSQAQESIKVTDLPDQIQEIYNGWIYSDEATNSYLYYTLYSAQHKTLITTDNTPLLLYLAGGPGDASTVTALTEFGPYGVTGNYNVSRNNLEVLEFEVFNRNITWTQYYHVMTIDCPVGVGYSFSKDHKTINTSYEGAEMMMTFLARFFEIYPSLIDNPFFIVGRSYGGHFGSALGYLILNNSYTLSNGIKVDFRGVFYSGGLINEGNQSRWSDLYYASGSTTQNFGIDLKLREINITLMEWEEDYESDSWDYILVFGKFVMNIATPNVTVDNLRQNQYKDTGESAITIYNEIGPILFMTVPFVNITTMRNTFNVPLNYSFQNVDVATPMFNAGDLAYPFNDEILAFLNNNISLGFLMGQDDGNLGFAGNSGLLFGLGWEGMPNYRHSPRTLLYAPNGTVIGAYKNYSVLSQYSIFKAGHLASMDQPESFLVALKDYVDRTVGI